MHGFLSLVFTLRGCVAIPFVIAVSRSPEHSVRGHDSEQPARRMPGGKLNIIKADEIASLITFARKDIVKQPSEV